MGANKHRKKRKLKDKHGREVEDRNMTISELVDELVEQYNDLVQKKPDDPNTLLLEYILKTNGIIK